MAVHTKDVAFFSVEYIYVVYYIIWDITCIFHKELHGVKYNICGIKVRPHAHERYKLYPSWCNLHGDFISLPFSIMKSLARHASWDIACIFLRHGRLL